MTDRSVVMEVVRHYWEYAGADVDHAHEIYHADAVLEFPQSGERFEGVETSPSGAAGTVMEGWEAPEWRASWRAEAPADPPD